MGLHNVAIASPQIVAAIGTSLIFRLLDVGNMGCCGQNIGWVLRMGALSSLVAALLTCRVEEEPVPETEVA